MPIVAERDVSIRTETLSPESVDHQPTVLIIDDDENLCTCFRRICGSSGMEVHEAHSGADGFLLAIEHVPDVVVTDLVMPLGMGDEVVDALKHCEITRAIPVIVITGLRDEDLIERMHSFGVREVFYKPFRFDELLQAVLSAARGARRK